MHNDIGIHNFVRVRNYSILKNVKCRQNVTILIYNFSVFWHILYLSIFQSYHVQDNLNFDYIF